MVKQRFLTHFKPWLFAVTKVVGFIVGYQLLNETRTYFQYTPLNSVDVVVAATAGIPVNGPLCRLSRWGERGWLQLRKVRPACDRVKQDLNKCPAPPTDRNSPPA